MEWELLHIYISDQIIVCEDDVDDLVSERSVGITRENDSACKVMMLHVEETWRGACLGRQCPRRGVHQAQQAFAAA